MVTYLHCTSNPNPDPRATAQKSTGAEEQLSCPYALQGSSWMAAAWQKPGPEFKSGCPEAGRAVGQRIRTLDSKAFASVSVRLARVRRKLYSLLTETISSRLSVLIWLKTMYRDHVETPQWTQPSQQVGGDFLQSCQEHLGA